MRVGRRAFLTSTAAAGVGAAIATAGGALGDAGAAEAAAAPIPFRAARQAGIVTPPQSRLIFASYDLNTTSRNDLVDLLKRWTEVADLLTRGLPVGGDGLDFGGQPLDTGEARDLDAARLTITFGFGRSLFDDRFGLKDLRPEALITLPISPGDTLDPNRSEGDIGIQVCADNQQVAFHAFHNLTRVARPVASLKWSQEGFQGGFGSARPRNLQGFKDGTNNLKVTDREAMDEHVWVSDKDEPGWMRGGTYMVTRRIRMIMEAWDRTPLAEQQRIIGRFKVSGAPLGTRLETDKAPIFDKKPDGEYVLPLSAHIRLAAPESNNGARLLRRGYSFTDGVDPANGLIDAGLFFVAFQRDLRMQFVLIQRRLFGDALSNFIRTNGSAAFACPPGVTKDGWVGQMLFEASRS